MTDREAIEHAKALNKFCKERGVICGTCPFVRISERVDRSLKLDCIFGDFDDYPFEWRLEEE